MSTPGVGQPGAGREELAGQVRVKVPKVVRKPEATLGGNRKQMTIRSGKHLHPSGGILRNVRKDAELLST